MSISGLPVSYRNCGEVEQLEASRSGLLMRGLAGRSMVLLMLAALLVSACSSATEKAEGPEQSDESVESFDLSFTDGQPARPLTSEEIYVVNAAHDQLISECMEDAGFSWNPPALQHWPVEADPYPSLSALRSAGYGGDLQAEFDSQRELVLRANSDPVNEVPAAQQSAYEHALFGDEEIGDDPSDSPGGGGCFDDADAQIYGSPEALTWLSQASEVGSVAQVRRELGKDPEYVRTRDDWQACMAELSVTWMVGDAEDPEWDSGYQALYVKMLMDDDVPAESLQQTVAQEDATCQESSGLAAVREQRLPEIRAELFDKGSVNEADRWRLQQYALANAKKVG